MPMSSTVFRSRLWLPDADHDDTTAVDAGNATSTANKDRPAVLPSSSQYAIDGSHPQTHGDESTRQYYLSK